MNIGDKVKIKSLRRIGHIINLEYNMGMKWYKIKLLNSIDIGVKTDTYTTDGGDIQLIESYKVNKIKVLKIGAQPAAWVYADNKKYDMYYADDMIEINLTELSVKNPTLRGTGLSQILQRILEKKSK